MHQYLFLSTLSLRRATRDPHGDAGRLHNFYPRSPCGERPVGIADCAVQGDFYPRSPCGERRRQSAGQSRPLDFYPRSPCGERQSQTLVLLAQQLFLSTLSLRRATIYIKNKRRAIPISIHALLAESDCCTLL